MQNKYLSTLQCPAGSESLAFRDHPVLAVDARRACPTRNLKQDVIQSMGALQFENPSTGSNGSSGVAQGRHIFLFPDHHLA